HPIGAPLLVLMTARDDLAQDDVRACARTRIAVAPLPQSDALALVRALLPLDEILCRRLAARVAGNPLFAVQLVGDWVARGTLVAGRRGFRLAEGRDPELPEDLYAVWSERITQFLAGRPTADERALELAAAYGQTVAGDAWRAVASSEG